MSQPDWNTDLRVREVLIPHLWLLADLSMLQGEPITRLEIERFEFLTGRQLDLSRVEPRRQGDALSEQARQALVPVTRALLDRGVTRDEAVRLLSEIGQGDAESLVSYAETLPAQES